MRLNTFIMFSFTFYFQRMDDYSNKNSVFEDKSENADPICWLSLSTRRIWSHAITLPTRLCTHSFVTLLRYFLQMFSKHYWVMPSNTTRMGKRDAGRLSERGGWKIWRQSRPSGLILYVIGLDDNVYKYCAVVAPHKCKLTKNLLFIY